MIVTGADAKIVKSQKEVNKNPKFLDKQVLKRIYIWYFHWEKYFNQYMKGVSEAIGERAASYQPLNSSCRIYT
jgi:hypothetical protein